MSYLFLIIFFSISICDDVHLWISSITENSIDLSIQANEPIYGFDFKIISDESGTIPIHYTEEEFTNDNTTASLLTIDIEQGLVSSNSFACFTDGQNRFISLSLSNNFLPQTDSTLFMRIPLSDNTTTSSYFISEPSFFTKDSEFNIIDLDIEYGMIEYQSGWPYTDTDKILGSPAIFDINLDGEKEIIFSDYTGKIFITNYSGQLLNTFQTDDQIWSTPAIADLNNDGTYELIVTSKDQHLYILNHEAEPILSYNANQYLLGTPAIGNIDSDAELEIIFAGYSNQGKIFAINMDGTNVEGFPLQINEKIQRGVALADINNNNKVDIILGTDSEHIHAIYDDASIAFTVELGGDIRSAPTVVKMGDQYLILVGSRDDHLHALSQSGDIIFSYLTGDKVESSPAILDHNDNVYIFFGSSDGYLYGIDTNGNNLAGFPIDIDSAVDSSPVIADLNGDQIPEIIVSSVSNDLKIFNLDGSIYKAIPLVFEFPFSGHPIIDDVDLDGDLEIFVGTTTGMIGIDLKDIGGNTENYWNQYRNSNLRTGYIESDQILSNTNIEYPTEIFLFSPYPNPFNPVTSISYFMPNAGHVQITVHDLNGRKVATVKNQFLESGYHTIDWNAAQISSGQYFINLTVDDYTITKPITLLK
tara:strand:- start:3587 stop:5521 length:1935 start_codon:yes stop_codon:yes gene_type:complete